MRLVLLAAAAALAASATLASAATSAKGRGVPRLAHVVLIVFENQERQAVLGSGAAPTFDGLAKRYAQATNDRAVAHPSLPNYLALVSGSTHGVVDDCTTCEQVGPTIGSQLTAAGRSWFAYAEGFPAGPAFAKKHVPFLYFPDDASGVVNLSQFDPKRLPAFSLVVPDLCHDMHDCSIATGDTWLARFIAPLLTVPRTAVFITFDEGTSNLGGGGLVPLIVAGTAVKPRASYGRAITHYSVLRTIESSLGLRPLGQAASAQPITGIWRGR